MALQDYFNQLMLIHEEVIPDSIGTHIEAYNKVLEFQGAITTVASAYSKRGEQPTPSSVYQLTTTKNIPLKFNDIIYDTNTKIYYQIDDDKMQTPKSANLSIQIFNLRKININVI